MRVVTMTDCTEEGTNDGEGDELRNSCKFEDATFAETEWVVVPAVDNGDGEGL